ncbi:carbohydrate ABC transporter permease [Treponema parvum]|uniref:Carbohydrate ABC transporter permease n=1 Tax=Treponema parvum TaxID=138851 RepID=A0A975F1F3_9SPIR|nr:carbohydrate ABC transporter permease [Treponema parvum]QTQ12709.1 carbohydrate ABC transporter permease [Treponema parvum]
MTIATKKKLSDIAFRNIPLAVFLVFTLFPFYWIINTSLKGSIEVFATPILYWPLNPTLANFQGLFTRFGFGTFFVNSVIVASVTTFLVTVMSLLGGYAMSRYKFKGKVFMYILLLITQMLPAVVLMIPLFQMMNNMKLINNLISLIIVCSCTNLPFCLFMMMGYFNSISVSLEEAAQIDGCTLLQSIFLILLPAMLPSIIATGAYAFINTWNVYVYATAFITDKAVYTLPLGLKMFQGEYGTDYGSLAAGCVVALVPVIMIFAFIQKHLSGGATAGAVKG